LPAEFAQAERSAAQQDVALSISLSLRISSPGVEPPRTFPRMKRYALLTLAGKLLILNMQVTTEQKTWHCVRMRECVHDNQ